MRNLAVVIAFLATFILGGNILFAQDWHTTIVDYEGIVGVFSSMALDSQGYPHISYAYSEDFEYDLKYACWTGSEWEIHTVDSEGDVGSRPSIALDSQDFPHITYYEYIDYYTGALKYAKWNGSEWEIQIVGSAAGIGEQSSIALDSQDHPHISFYGDSNLKYACWTGIEWEIQTVDSEEFAGPHNFLVLDGDDYPHISYYVGGYTGDLKYACWTGSEWNIQTIDYYWFVGMFNCIALDSEENPHISYAYDDYPFQHLRYAQWTGGNWDIQTVDDNGHVGDENSLSIDSQDYPHISYYDDTNGDLKYAHWTGSEWDIQVVDYQGKVGWYTSLALDNQDYPHISYYAISNQDLKYAWYGTISKITLDHFTAKPDNSAISLRWSVDITEGDQITGFNLYRRELSAEQSSLADIAHHGIKDDWIKINPTIITGENPYTYTDSDVEPGVAYEYKLSAVLADDSQETLGTTQATAGLLPASFAILALYPNPASDMLTCLLALPEAGPVELMLYDLSGRLVLSQHLEATEPTELEAILDAPVWRAGFTPCGRLTTALRLAPGRWW